MVSDIEVEAYDYCAITTASNIAKVFNVPLQTVLSDIKTAIKEIDPLLDHSNECIEEWFDPFDSDASTNNDYSLSKNGAMYIFMKYSGKHAAEAKVKYIKAFDEMIAECDRQFNEDQISNTIHKVDKVMANK